MNKLKKIAGLLLATIITTSALPIFAEPTAAPTPAADNSIFMEDPSLTAPDTSNAGAVLLMDMNSNRVLYSKNADKKMYPASTTKMMTAILALESDKMGDTVTATYEALESITLEDSHMGILIGEVLTMEDLVNSTLIYSANDAANVIAVHVGGSLPDFIDMMNAKAQELGLTNTHFVNACGVHDDDHYTTATDLAKLAKYCMQNEKFREIVKKPTYHIDPTNKYTQNRDLPATNLFLSAARSAHHVYAPCTGIKTGTTDAAGHCLVSSAKYNGMELLSVVLKASDWDVTAGAYSYTISRAMFDFGFNNYESGVLASPGTVVADSKVYEAKRDQRVTLTVENEIYAIIPKGKDISSEITMEVEIQENVSAPITKGEVLGQVVYKYKDGEIARANLLAANDVELNKVLHVFHLIIKFITHPLFFIPVIIIIIALLVKKSKKAKAERRRKLHQIRQRREGTEGTPEEYAQKRTIQNAEQNRRRLKNSNSRYKNDK